MMFFVLMPIVIFDIISTEIALKMGARERNPIMRNKWVKWILNILVKLTAPSLMFYIQITIPSYYLLTEIIFLIYTIVYGMIAINNTIIILKLRKENAVR